MGVFREVKIEYLGKEYFFTPTNRLLRRIERELSLADMLTRIGTGKPPVSEIAYVTSMFMQEAGIEDVDEDSIYAELMEDVQSEGKVFSHMVVMITEAVSPTVDVVKKSVGPAKSSQKARKKSSK